MSKHTSGPWNLHHGYQVPVITEVSESSDGAGDGFTAWTCHIAAGEKIIGQTRSYSNEVGWPHANTPEEAVANARLIAAAPELLDALQALMSNPHISLDDTIYQVRENEGLGWEGPSVRSWSEAITKVKRAIAKATNAGGQDDA